MHDLRAYDSASVSGLRGKRMCKSNRDAVQTKPKYCAKKRIDEVQQNRMNAVHAWMRNMMRIKKNACVNFCVGPTRAS